MSATTILPNHLRPRREKVFGPPRGIPLDRNAKTRIMVYARAWSAKHKQPGQHRGPLTRATLEVMEAGFLYAKVRKATWPRPEMR
jgi:hypothetical protein